MPLRIVIFDKEVGVMNVAQAVQTQQGRRGFITMSETVENSKLDWNRINLALSWDLSGPIAFLVNRQSKNASHVDLIAREYRRYLGIIAVYPKDRFPVSEEVDEMWHTHILFTRDYRKMSDAIRGEYINHDPILTEPDRLALEPYYHKGTLVRYREIYGEPAPEWLWPRVGGAICWSGYEVLLARN